MTATKPLNILLHGDHRTGKTIWMNSFVTWTGTGPRPNFALQGKNYYFWDLCVTAHLTGQSEVFTSKEVHLHVIEPIVEVFHQRVPLKLENIDAIIAFHSHDEMDERRSNARLYDLQREFPKAVTEHVFIEDQLVERGSESGYAQVVLTAIHRNFHRTVDPQASIWGISTTESQPGHRDVPMIHILQKLISKEIFLIGPRISNTSPAISPEVFSVEAAQESKTPGVTLTKEPKTSSVSLTKERYAELLDLESALVGILTNSPDRVCEYSNFIKRFCDLLGPDNIYIILSANKCREMTRTDQDFLQLKKELANTQQKNEELQERVAKLWEQLPGNDEKTISITEYLKWQRRADIFLRHEGSIAILPMLAKEISVFTFKICDLLENATSNTDHGAAQEAVEQAKTLAHMLYADIADMNQWKLQLDN